MIPRYEVPRLPGMTRREKVALVIGTGLGTGFMKPMAPTWGSIPGFVYFAAVSRLLPMWAGVGIFAGMLIPAVWSGTICERLLGGKDPRAVVIDEIAAVPFALWPLWVHWPGHWVTWVWLFGVYRVMDYLKPWPANRMEGLKGGVGIMMDDVVSSAYMGLGLWGLSMWAGWLL